MSNFSSVTSARLPEIIVFFTEINIWSFAENYRFLLEL
jgi:hypothetical protein